MLAYLDSIIDRLTKIRDLWLEIVALQKQFSSDQIVGIGAKLDS